MLLSCTFIASHFNKNTFAGTFDSGSLSSLNSPFVANWRSRQDLKEGFATETHKDVLMISSSEKLNFRDHSFTVVLCVYLVFLLLKRSVSNGHFLVMQSKSHQIIGFSSRSQSILWNIIWTKNGKLSKTSNHSREDTFYKCPISIQLEIPQWPCC